MNRKTEKIVIWTGVTLSIIYAGIITFFLVGFNTPEALEAIKNSGEIVYDGRVLAPEEIVNWGVSALSGLLVAVIASIAMAVVSLSVIKKNRVVAGVLLLIAAFLSLITGAFISSVLWLIAGIAFVVSKGSKAKKATQTEEV